MASGVFPVRAGSERAVELTGNRKPASDKISLVAKAVEPTHM